MKKLLLSEALAVALTMTPEFSKFWFETNDELKGWNVPTARFADVLACFNWVPMPSPEQAAGHIMGLRGDR